MGARQPRDEPVAPALDGSVRRSGNRIRVTVQLVDAANGFRLWSERYDREMADIFAVQAEIALAIAGRLKPRRQRVEQAGQAGHGERRGMGAGSAARAGIAPQAREAH
jgi:hypothetical protein